MSSALPGNAAIRYWLAATNLQGVEYGVVNEILCLGDRSPLGQACGPASGNGSGEGTPGAVIFPANPLNLPLQGVGMVSEEGIGDLRALAVTAGGQNRLAACCHQRLRGFGRVIAVAKHGQLNPVGGNHLRTAEQVLLHCLDQGGVCQIAASRGFDNRIGNHGDVGVPVQKLHQNINDFGIAQGAGFNGVNGGVCRHTVQLPADKVCINSAGVVYVAGILNGQAGQDRQRMAAQCGDGLNVGLDAGPSRRVKARQDQYLGASIAFYGSAPQNGLTTTRMTTATSTSTGSSLNQR